MSVLGFQSFVIQTDREFEQNSIQSTLGFATMGKAANLALATRNDVTDLF